VIAFLFGAVALTLAAVGLVVVPLFRQQSPAPVAAVTTALAIPAAVMLLYATISTYPWGVDGTSVTATATALKERLANAPEDAGGWVSLGDEYITQERFAEARDAYHEAIRLGETSDGTRLAFAEAAILADRQALAGEAGRIMDEVLSRDPENRKALWYGGMAALARGDAAGARARWSQLLELSPPPQVRQIIEEQLADMDAPVTGGPRPAQPAASTMTIPVRVTVKPDLAARIRPGAALFLIARTPGGTGPPLAVVRRESARLPLEVEISDADSMVPGRSMAGLDEVRLTARMANDGEALAAPGDVFGETLWKRAGAAGMRLEILMDQVVE
jgi:cytochrome c-type biogenesis protein CcmH